MNLSERLAKIRHDFETGETPTEIIKVLNDHVETLLNSNVAEQALKVGQSVGLDGLVQSDEGPVSLSSLFGERFLVLTWFRGNW